MTAQFSVHPDRDKSGVLEVLIQEIYLGDSEYLFTTLTISFEGEREKAVFFPNMSVEELLVMFPTATVERPPR